MKTLTKPLVMLFFILGLNSCTYQIPVSKVSPENNKTYEVDFLFEHDGCKVYRFRDKGNYVYFTNCNGDVTNVKSDTIQIKTLTNRYNLKK
jgi:hypothetical protein